MNYLGIKTSKEAGLKSNLFNCMECNCYKTKTNVIQTLITSHYLNVNEKNKSILKTVIANCELIIYDNQIN